MKKILLLIAKIIISIDYNVFHRDIPWHIYRDTQLEAIWLSDLEKKKEQEKGDK